MYSASTDSRPTPKPRPRPRPSARRTSSSSSPPLLEEPLATPPTARGVVLSDALGADAALQAAQALAQLEHVLQQRLAQDAHLSQHKGLAGSGLRRERPSAVVVPAGVSVAAAAGRRGRDLDERRRPWADAEPAALSRRHADGLRRRHLLVRALLGVVPGDGEPQRVEAVEDGGQVGLGDVAAHADLHLRVPEVVAVHRVILVERLPRHPQGALHHLVAMVQERRHHARSDADVPARLRLRLHPHHARRHRHLHLGDVQLGQAGAGALHAQAAVEARAGHGAAVGLEAVPAQGPRGAERQQHCNATPCEHLRVRGVDSEALRRRRGFGRKRAILGAFGCEAIAKSAWPLRVAGEPYMAMV
eukprot:scaffold310_cov307-Pinguiococcus_pyrenoidosus.AAC.8